MEPITAAILGSVLWDNLGQPVLDKAKEKYSEKVLEKIDAVLVKLPFKKKERELIEAEIMNADKKLLTDKKNFIEFIQNNQRINEVLSIVNKREQSININVEKGIGYIDKMNGDISF